VEEQIREFLTALDQDKGYARNTVEAYRNDLTQFLHFAQNERATLAQWSRVDKPLLLTFVMHLKERGYTPSSVARKIAVLKTFFHFLAERKIIDSDPTATLGSPKVEKRLPQTLSAEDITRLLAAPAKNNTPKGFRDRAMLELLYASGMRVTDLTSLNLDDVNLQAQTVHVGREGKQRVIPIQARAADVLAYYLQRGRPEFAPHANERALFVNPHGERLTRQGLWLIIKECVQEAGIMLPVTPHTLRHSFAVHLLSNGAELQDVQRLLGHANLSTTQVYARLADAAAEASPAKRGE
jgi:integrase/recombinase XerD